MTALTSVIDILPDVVDATAEGRLQWKRHKDNRDFITEVGDYRVEMEFIADSENGNSAIVVYLWDSTDTIIDSEVTYQDDRKYPEILSHFQSVRRSALNVSAALTSIVSTLRQAP